MGEVERLQSNVARDAAAMQAVGVLVEAKALKLDMLGGCRSINPSTSQSINQSNNYSPEWGARFD